MTNLSEVVSKSFIWGVGITHPKPKQERVAALYITLSLIGTIVAVVGVLALLLSRF